MKNWFKKENASMTIYVAVSIFSFMIILTAVFFASSAVRKSQIQTIPKIKEAYEQDIDNINQIYEDRKAQEQQYIQEGLILHYDGINNTGNGHSTTTNTWKDLSGNDYDITSIQGIIGDNYLQLTGSQVMDIPITGNFSNMTVEITISDIEQTDTTALHFYGSAERLFSMHIPWSDNNIYFDTSQDSTGYQRLYKTIDFDKIEKHTITFRKSTIQGMAIYIDGNLWAQDNTLTRSIGNVFGAKLGAGYGSLSAYYLKGKIYSIRVYSRSLTQEEITNNYTIDQGRFEM